MADPYNPYTSYSTPTPGGVVYYPPEEQSHAHQQPGYQYQQPYGGAEQQDPNYGYAPQQNPSPSPYHLAPEQYLGGAPARSYTPVGQPDYMGPASTSGMPPAGEGKVPENLSYYGHPADRPRYTPSASPRPPSVHVSNADQKHYRGGEDRPSDQDGDAEGERGIGSSLAGGAAGYYFGHKKDHGLLGAIGGAIVGNFLEDKLKDSGRHSQGHHHEHGSGHHHHHHHHRHSRSRSHSRHRGEDDY